MQRFRCFAGMMLLSALLFPNRCAIGSDDNPQKPDAAPASPSSPPAASASRESPAFSFPKWLSLSGVIRGRYEAPSGTSAANSALDEYYLSRLRLELAVTPAPWVRFVVQAQDSRAFGYNAVSQPASIYDPLDVRQAYAEFGTEGRFGVKLRAGRQELVFGSGRLLGLPDWTNLSRSFDAADLTLSYKKAKLDLFGGSVVLADPSRLDRHKPGEHIYGAYGSAAGWLPGASIEPYLLFKQALNVTGEVGGIGDAILVTPGIRVAGKAAWRMDYAAEIAMQRGSFAADRVSALAGSYVAGWTVNGSALKPRFSVEFNHASGDGNSRNGLRGTFDQLYPGNHPYYGIADQVGWKNMRNLRAGFDCVVTRRLKMRTDFNDFYLATVQDGLYNSGGTRIVMNTHASSRHVGSEADLQAQYQWSSTLQFAIGYGRLFAGAYLRDSTKANGYSYPYVSFTKKL